MTAILTGTPEMLAAAHDTAKEAAKRAAEDFLNEHFGGEDRGACGFAWVIYVPKNKGNTRLGRRERQLIESIGYRKDHNNNYRFNNPSGWPGQNIDVRWEGAHEYATRLEQMTGIYVGVETRLD